MPQSKTEQKVMILDEITQQDLETIRRLVYDYTGIKLGTQKKAMIQSRLMKRLKQIGCPTFERYVKMVKLNPVERATMFNLLTTNVTKFFRESHHFDYVTEQFLPKFLSETAGTRPLKIWSAGCSTGQEPYSLAIALNEFFAAYPGRDFHITATDINTDVIQKAAQGIYIWEEVNDIPYDLLKKYFKLGTGPNAGLFKVKEAINRKVSFKFLNLVDFGSDYPVQGPFDLIFCRNVFIYFDQATKSSIVKRFYDKLCPGGCLFLGHSESLNLNEPRNGKWSIQQHTVYMKDI